MSQSALSSSSRYLSAAMSLVSYVNPPSVFTTVNGTPTPQQSSSQANQLQQCCNYHHLTFVLLVSKHEIPSLLQLQQTLLLEVLHHAAHLALVEALTALRQRHLQSLVDFHKLGAAHVADERPAFTRLGVARLQLHDPLVSPLLKVGLLVKPPNRDKVSGLCCVDSVDQTLVDTD